MSSLKIWLILCICNIVLCCVNTNVYAQGRYVSTLYKASDGLPQQTVSVSFQDKLGYMWFATLNGFCKFDGKNFTKYYIGNDDSVEGINNQIRWLGEDSQKNIWVISQDDIAFCFNPETKKVISLPNNMGKVKKIQILSDGDVYLCLQDSSVVRAYYNKRDEINYEKIITKGSSIPSIYSGKNGNVWLLSRTDLMEYSSHTRTLIKRMSGEKYNFQCLRKRSSCFILGSDSGKVYIYYEKYNKYEISRFPTLDTIVHIKSFSDTENIFMTKNDGFFLRDIKNTQTIHYSVSSENSYRLASNKVKYCYVDKDKNIWVTYINNPVITCIETNKRTVRQFYLLDRYRNRIHSCPRIVIFEDRNRRIWFCSQNIALNYYDMQSKQLLPLILPYSQNMPDFTEPTNLYIDKQRNLWLGKDNKGIMKITFKSDNFQLISPDSKDIFSHENDIRGLCLDKYNRLWVGARDSSIRIYDSMTKCFLGYISKDGNLTSRKNSIGEISSIIQASDGNIWIGTTKQGIIRVVLKNEKKCMFDVFTPIDGDIYSISSGKISSIYEDSAHRIWIGTVGGGVNMVHYDEKGHILFLNSKNHLGNYPNQYQNVRCICEDGNRNIWIATTNGLLKTELRNDYESMSFDIINNVLISEENVNSNIVLSMLKTHDNNLYLATLGKGLCKLIQSGNKYRFVNYTTSYGLSSNIIYSINEDVQNNLWLETEEGLCLFNTKDESIEVFDNRFFPFDLTFYGRGTVRCVNNEIIKATDRGILIFNPLSLQKDRFVPNLVLTSFTANDKQIYNSQNKVVSFGEKEPVTLTHEQNSFDLSFQALDMNFPEKIQYAYKLEGFDDWHYVGNDGKAVYTNIPKGEYIFKVKSTNSDGRWVENEASLVIYVLPSFWESLGGRLLLVIIFLIIIVIVTYFLFLLYNLKNRVRLERELAEAKNYFFTNIVHEMRTPFTLIVSPLENVLDSKDLSADVRQNLEVMQKNTQRSIRLLNQILDFQKVKDCKMHLCVQQVELRSFFDQLIRSFSGVAQNEQIDLVLDMEAPSIMLWADFEKLESIFFNLLSNAFKYSPKGKTITIKVEEFSSKVRIEVTDQGYGIPDDKQKIIFNRFETLIQKYSKYKPSTGIGLSLLKEFIELHHGSISVNSQIGIGTTFIVEFLKGTNHFTEDTDFIMNDRAGEECGDEMILLDHKDNEHQLPVVLIVEDNMDLQRFLKKAFADSFYPIVANNGQEGVEQAVKCNPDIIVSDINMPIMNGFEMVRTLKSNIATSHISIILLTSQANNKDEIESMEMGVSDYISKPFSSKVLLARINSILQRRKLLQQYFQSQILHDDLSLDNELDESKENTMTSVLSPADKALIERITKYIKDNISSEELSVESIARECCVSRSVLLKKIKSLIGITPVELIRNIRIQKAVELLEYGELNITEIAFRTGFYDSHYFAKCFKQVYNMSPTEYKKSFLKRNYSNFSENI